jgi:hypothetical protein
VNAASVRALTNAFEAVKHDPVRLAIQAERVTASRWRWAAFMLARDTHTLESIIAGRPVMAGCLHGEVLRRALRGEILPPADSYIRIRNGHLDAVAEAGRLP